VIKIIVKAKLFSRVSPTISNTMPVPAINDLIAGKQGKKCPYLKLLYSCQNINKMRR
jgi:hypothetical protein